MSLYVQYIEYVVIQKETSTKMYTSFSIGLINNMDHMRISGNKLSSVIHGRRSLKVATGMHHK